MLLGLVEVSKKTDNNNKYCTMYDYSFFNLKTLLSPVYNIVPSRGFSVLQGTDGNIRKFTIHGVKKGSCPYPRSHTCFNRIDLPMYETRKELYNNIKVAIELESTGFGQE